MVGTNSNAIVTTLPRSVRRFVKTSFVSDLIVAKVGATPAARLGIEGPIALPVGPAGTQASVIGSGVALRSAVSRVIVIAIATEAPVDNARPQRLVHTKCDQGLGWNFHVLPPGKNLSARSGGSTYSCPNRGTFSAIGNGPDNGANNGATTNILPSAAIGAEPLFFSPQLLRCCPPRPLTAVH